MAQIKYLGLNSLREMVSQNDARYVKKTDEKTYSIERLAAAEDSYAATYQLVDEDGTKVGASINIPMDYLVRSAEIKTTDADDSPVAGMVSGDKYIEFVVNSVNDDGTESKIYLPVKDLASVYTAGTGIEVSNTNEIALKLDATNANGLAVGIDGLSLSLASATQAGAISAADYARIDGALQEEDMVEITADEVSAIYAGGVTPTPPTPTPTKITVKFMDGTGTTEIAEAQEVDKGGHLADPGTPTDPPEGAVAFIGWKPNTEAGTEPWDFTNDTVEGEMTLYAIWAVG